MTAEAYSFDLGKEGEMLKRHLLFPEKTAIKKGISPYSVSSAYDRDHNVFKVP